MKLRKGKPRGEKHGRAKLTENDVKIARMLYDRGFSIKDLADAFLVSWTAVSNCITYETWKHVK